MSSPHTIGWVEFVIWAVLACSAIVLLCSVAAQLCLKSLATNALSRCGRKRKLWLFACALATGLSWSCLLAATSLLVWGLYEADRANDSFATTLLTAFIAAALVTIMAETYKLSSVAYGKKVAGSLRSAIPESATGLRESFNVEKEWLVKGSSEQRRNALEKIFQQARDEARTSDTVGEPKRTHNKVTAPDAASSDGSSGEHRRRPGQSASPRPTEGRRP